MLVARASTTVMSPNALVPLFVMVPRPFVVLAKLAQLSTLPVVNRVAAPRTADRLHMAWLVQLCVVRDVPLMPDALTFVKPTARMNPLASLSTLTIVLLKLPSPL